MKQDTLSYRIFSASLLYFIGTLFIFSLYRIYTQEYIIVLLYGVGMIAGGVAYRMTKRGKQLNRIVLPSVIFTVLFGIFFWFRVGGVHGGGLVFFTFILISIIVIPNRYSKVMVVLLVGIQLILVGIDYYFPELPFRGNNPNSVLVYLIAVLINTSVVWMLKYNYDRKEEKTGEFSKGIRELHRLNLKHNINLIDLLNDYLTSGEELFQLKKGFIVSCKDDNTIFSSLGFNYQHEKSNETLIDEIKSANETKYQVSGNGNILTEDRPECFLGTPLIVNDEVFGVLGFYEGNSKRKIFEEYEIEILELMALNLGHLIQLQLWKKNQEDADKALLLSEKRFKSIYDYANVGICVCDLEGKVVMANLALQDLLEYSEEEMLGQSFYSISASNLEEINYDLQQYERIILGEISHYIIEKRNKTKSGREIVINKTVSTVRDEAENMRFTVMIVDDITIRKENEAKINKLNKALELQVNKMEEANKELEAFSYSVSHDLRAPLRAIDGFSKIILEDHKEEFSSESERLLNVIIKNSGKMAALIDDLLTFSRISRLVAEFKMIDLNDIIHSVIEEHALEASLFEISSLPEVKGEKTLIKQVFSNLIGNAVKFSSKNSNPKIEIGYKENKDNFEFYLKDNGVGFNMAYYNKVFGVFQRLHTDEEFKGTGVGLAIVHKVIMKHHGKVWAESEEGKGATFYFSLPK